MSQPSASEFAEPTLSQPQGTDFEFVPGPHSNGPSETSFYNQYEWCLNPFLTLSGVIRHLEEELGRAVNSAPGWSRDEICRNIYLLSCAILDLTDDYLLARKYDFSKLSAGLPVLRPVVSTAERVFNRAGRVVQNPSKLTRWREKWQAELIRGLKLCIASSSPEKDDLSQLQKCMQALLDERPLRALRNQRVRIPGAYRSQDLTHFDVLALGQKFISTFPAGKRATVLGLRTAGSYFAPLLHAYLELNNYADVESLTIRAKHGTSEREAAALRRCAKNEGWLIIVDEPIGSGGTLAKAVQIACRYSIPRDKIVILTPIHPSARNWREGSGYHLLSDLVILTLEPEEWYKWGRLDAEAEALVTKYFQARGMTVHRVSGQSAQARRFNEQLESVSEIKGHTRLKRVYEVVLSGESDRRESRYVLAKSVGWGWLSYHAFLAAERLSQFVPNLLGLRDGILYGEWHPENGSETAFDHNKWIDRAASYIAARTRTLTLEEDPAHDLVFENRNNGLANLAGSLTRAYGSRPAPFLRRGRICHELTRMACPLPTLIDGKLRPLEWIHATTGALKCDFEHHGLGKTEINMTDPAYDLAEAILTWQLSSAEEKRLIECYIKESGDGTVGDRLLVNKLAAGVRAVEASLANLQDPRLAERGQEFNRDYLAAWNFLVLHTMRYCAGFCRKPEHMEWRPPLVVMDVDGVLDKQSIGFPSTSWAGMQAVSLLHSHKLSVVLNTARSVTEVKEYCRHYGFLGGIAEYGAYAWDATSDREQVLVTQESLAQLRRLAEELWKIPGIFLNHDYLYSIRAYTFDDGTTKALPGLLIQNLISQLRLNRLSIHQTYTDTAVVAKESDKGKGTRALLELAGYPDIPTLAIGDSSADLPMFAVAKSSFAPGHISCHSQARALGTYIDPEPFQPGLLNIVRRIVHPEKGSCERCRSAELPKNSERQLVLQVLKHADESKFKRLLRAALDPKVMQSFLAN